MQGGEVLPAHSNRTRGGKEKLPRSFRGRERAKMEREDAEKTIPLTWEGDLRCTTSLERNRIEEESAASRGCPGLEGGGMRRNWERGALRWQGEKMRSARGRGSELYSLEGRSFFENLRRGGGRNRMR